MIKAEKIIEEFLAKNPRKMCLDKRWKHKNPEQYSAAVTLYKMGYAPIDITKHIGCKYDVLRKTLIRDNLMTPKKYKTKSDEVENENR